MSNIFSLSHKKIFLGGVYRDMKSISPLLNHIGLLKKNLADFLPVFYYILLLKVFLWVNGGLNPPFGI